VRRNEDSNPTRLDERREALKEEHGIWEAAEKVGSQHAVKLWESAWEITRIALNTQGRRGFVSLMKPVKWRIDLGGG
jgi:hypothetical protein